MVGTVVRFDPLRVVEFGDYTGDFVTMGDPFAHKVRIVDMLNTSDKDAIISFDGVEDHVYVPAGGFVLYDIEANTLSGFEFTFSLHTQPYVNWASAPTSGAVILGAAYGQGE